MLMLMLIQIEKSPINQSPMVIRYICNRKLKLSHFIDRGGDDGMQ